ncbi:hypothetical protein [Brucella pseudogrignonensis]|nr:hypothetical protein [Brucella pseudogrignonensis]
MSMLLTKHCRPLDLERMLNGYFKIGSHEEYSKGETAGTLSDTAEGQGGFSLQGDLVSFTGNIGSSRFENVSSIGSGSGFSLVFNDKINSLMFCASLGAYDPKRHEAIMRGDLNRSYAPNEELTAYLTLDADKLNEALVAATDEFFGVRTRWISCPVSYGERQEILDANQFNGFDSQHLMMRLAKQASLKPDKFQVEQEFRFLMVLLPNRELPEVILSKDLSTDIHEAFKRTIVDTGHFSSGSI